MRNQETTEPYSRAEIDQAGNNAARQLHRDYIQNLKYPTAAYNKVYNGPVDAPSDMLLGEATDDRHWVLSSPYDKLHSDVNGKTVTETWSRDRGALATDLATTKSEKAMSGIDQGNYGDCPLESAIAGLADSRHGVNEISRMITETSKTSQSGGKSSEPTPEYFTVNFPGAKHPVKVSVSQLEKQESSLKHGANAGYSNLEDSAGWAAVLEQAALKLHPDWKHGTTGSATLQLLTGTHRTKDITESGGNGNTHGYGEVKPHLGALINRKLENNRIVLAATYDHLPCENNHGLEPLVDGHEYTVTGFDRKTNQVTVRNPWGTQSQCAPVGKSSEAYYETKSGQTAKAGEVMNLGGGEFRMSMSTFARTFQELDMSDKK